MNPLDIGVIVVGVAFILGAMIFNHYIAKKLRAYNEANKPTK